MHNSAIRIMWDDNDRKQVEDAKVQYQAARKAGRRITDINGKAIDTFKPSFLELIIQEKELKENELAVRVFDETGDRRLIWDMSDQDQVKDAAKLFNEYLAKGWRGYTVDASGATRRRIHKFDIDQQEIVFEEKEFKSIIADFTSAIKNEIKEVAMKTEKIASFVKCFSETKLVPKTFPG